MPARFIADKLFGIRDKGSASMHRGTATEFGLSQKYTEEAWEIDLEVVGTKFEQLCQDDLIDVDDDKRIKEKENLKEYCNILNKHFDYTNLVDYQKKIEINIDNKLSSTYTVLTVKTNDRFALLYDLSKILLNNRLVIFTAKISTDGDFVEDSFHIRTEYGSKLLVHMQIKNLEAEIYKLLSRKVTNAN